MRRSVTPLICGMTLCVCQCALSSAHADLTHYIPFGAGYGPGDLNGQGGQDLGFGANTWFDGNAPGDGSSYVGSSLSGPTGLPTAGGSATTHPANFDLAFYTMDQNNNGANGEPDDRLQPGEHWISFIARADSESFFGGLSLVKFFGDEVLYIGKIGGQGGTQWGVDTGGNPVVAGGDATVDTLLVAKLTIGAGANDDLVELFINPALGTTAPLTPDLSVPFNEDAANNRGLDEIRLGSQNGFFAADEIRIGMTFADVAVPAPGASVLAIGLGALTLGRRRRNA